MYGKVQVPQADMTTVASMTAHTNTMATFDDANAMLTCKSLSTILRDQYPMVAHQFWFLVKLSRTLPKNGLSASLNERTEGAECKIPVIGDGQVVGHWVVAVAYDEGHVLLPSSQPQ